MTSREHAPVETITEWGVRWQNGLWAPGDIAEADAREFAAGLHPGYHPQVVCRTVTRTEYRLVSEGGAPDA